MPTFAQVATALSSDLQKPEKPLSLPSPLTQQASRDHLAMLDDKQVRAVLTGPERRAHFFFHYYIGRFGDSWICRSICIASRILKARRSVFAAIPRPLWHKSRLLVPCFFFLLSHVIAFFLIATAFNLTTTQSGSPDRYTVRLVIKSDA